VLSLDCREENLSDYMVRECGGAFMDKIDAFAYAALEFRNILHDSGKLLVNGQALLSQIASLGAGVEGYVLKCMGNSMLKSSPAVNDIYKSVTATTKAINSVSRLVPVMQQRLDSKDLSFFGSEEKVWKDLNQAYNTSLSVRGMKQALEKGIADLYDAYRGPEARSRSELQQAEEATRKCKINTADRQLRQAGEDAVRALEDAYYRKAKNERLRSCWTEKATDYFESLRMYEMNQWIGNIKRWQTMSPDHPLFMSCTACGHWRDAARNEIDAKIEAARLDEYLPSVNNA